MIDAGRAWPEEDSAHAREGGTWYAKVGHGVQLPHHNRGLHAPLGRVPWPQNASSSVVADVGAVRGGHGHAWPKNTKLKSSGQGWSGVDKDQGL